eukprot:15446401-Alexandrium_andersonii.AAC.1
MYLLCLSHAETLLAHGVADIFHLATVQMYEGMLEQAGLLQIARKKKKPGPAPLEDDTGGTCFRDVMFRMPGGLGVATAG